MSPPLLALILLYAPPLVFQPPPSWLLLHSPLDVTIFHKSMGQVFVKYGKAFSTSRLTDVDMSVRK